MPTNRKRVDRSRSDVVNPNQEGFLRCGFDTLAGYPGFDDEEHAREAWAANRDRLIAEWDRPGERPWAYWAYHWGLDEGRTAGGNWDFAWPPPIQSEEEAVYDLLKRGELQSCRRNGIHPIDSEPRVIRENWLREIAIELAPVDSVPPHTTALSMYGCPVWFYDEHAPRILAERRQAG